MPFTAPLIDLSKIRPGDEVTVRARVLNVLERMGGERCLRVTLADSEPRIVQLSAIVSHTPAVREFKVGDRVKVDGMANTNCEIVAIVQPRACFQQGYIEGLFDSFQKWGIPTAQDSVMALGFSDLAPDTLAAILKDCGEFTARWEPAARERRDGQRFWLLRQRQEPGLEAFPPLTVFLDNDGKIRTRSALAQQDATS